MGGQVRKRQERQLRQFRGQMDRPPTTPGSIKSAAYAAARVYEDWLEGLAPHEPISRYRHNRSGEDNGDAHLKRQIMGREVVVAITDSKLDFGPWEQIFYGEFDGRRRKRVLIKIIGE